MKLAPASAELGLALLRTDPQFGRIPEDRRTQWVSRALRDGRRLAQRACKHWGNDPYAIATACGIPIIESEAEAGFGSTVIYAEYASTPATITLYVRAIRRLDTRIAANFSFDWGIEETAPVFLAHELYHHFDCLRAGRALIRRHRVRVMKLGSWTLTAGLATLPEIAAGAFAQQLLGLTFHPKLLDVLATGRSGL